MAVRSPCSGNGCQNGSEDDVRCDQTSATGRGSSHVNFEPAGSTGVDWILILWYASHYFRALFMCWSTVWGQHIRHRRLLAHKVIDCVRFSDQPLSSVDAERIISAVQAYYAPALQELVQYLFPQSGSLKKNHVMVGTDVGKPWVIRSTYICRLWSVCEDFLSSGFSWTHQMSNSLTLIIEDAWSPPFSRPSPTCSHVFLWWDKLDID